jgi:hypothetical protein
MARLPDSVVAAVAGVPLDGHPAFEVAAPFLVQACELNRTVASGFATTNKDARYHLVPLQPNCSYISIPPQLQVCRQSPIRVIQLALIVCG